MRLGGAVYPIQPLCKSVVGGVIVGGKVMNKAHDAGGTRAAFATADRDLSGKSSAGKCARVGRYAVFTKRDGWMLAVNSCNHGILKK